MQESKLNSIGRWLVTLALAVLPLFFLPTTQDFYDTNKWLLLVGAAVAVFVIWTIRTIRTHEISLGNSPLLSGVLALTAASLVSMLGAPGSKVEAITGSFGFVSFVSLAVCLVFGTTFFTRESRTTLRSALMVSTALCGLIAAYQAMGIGRYLTSVFPALGDPLWSPTGASTGLLVILLVSIPAVISAVIRQYRRKADTALVSSVIALLLIGAGLILTLYRFVPLFTRAILPVGYGWTIALEAFKNPRTAIFGVGTQNYLSAFTIGKPISINTTPLWNVRFGTGSTFLLHLATTYGVLGIVAGIVFLRGLWNTKDNPWQKASTVIALLAVVLLPVNLAALTFIIALRMATDDEHGITTMHLPQLPWVTPVLATMCAGVVLAASLFVGRVYAAEVAFYRSLRAAQRNNGTDTYNLQRKALQLNTNAARYHIAYSQTNLALANSLALSFAAEATQSAQSEDQATGDRQLIATLVQQAIREGKVAVNLAPTNVIAWENLARVYQSLAPIAQGADVWAVASYQQAIALDPTNPILRLDLGGMYIRQENYDSAIQQFLIATQLKIDFANAHYNLANAYRLTGDNDKAAAELEATRTLITQGTDDYTKVVGELDELKKKKTSEPLPSGETLTTPREPTPIMEPRLTLPESAQPEATRAAGE